MFDKKNIKKAQFYENLIIDIFNKFGLKNIKLNNINNKTDVDIIYNDNIKIDVQYFDTDSFNKFKTLNIDYISSYKKDINKEEFYYKLKKKKFNTLKEINSFIKKELEVKKWGKIFQKNYLNYIIYIPDKDYKLNNIYVLSNNRLLHLLRNHINIIKNLKLNNKTKYSLKDDFGSAFLPLDKNFLLKKGIIIDLEQFINILKSEQSINNNYTTKFII